MCHTSPTALCSPGHVALPYDLKPDASWPRSPRLILCLYSKIGPERRLVDLGPMPGTVLWLDSTVATWPATRDSFARRAVRASASGRRGCRRACGGTVRLHDPVPGGEAPQSARAEARACTSRERSGCPTGSIETCKVASPGSGPLLEPGGVESELGGGRHRRRPIQRPSLAITDVRASGTSRRLHPS
jgi:hypothetical protein